MRAAMDESRHQNQTLNDNVLNIQQRQHEATHTEEMEVPNPYPISDEIWETPFPEGFKPPSLVKFDESSDLYKHVTSGNT